VLLIVLYKNDCLEKSKGQINSLKKTIFFKIHKILEKGSPRACQLPVIELSIKNWKVHIMKRRIFSLVLGALSLALVGQEKAIVQFWQQQLQAFSFDSNKQSFCYEHNGSVVGENVDLQVKPASVTKLYTTLWSLDQLGKDFRFQTKFSIKNNNLFIVGGSDPFMVTENIFLVLNELQSLGIQNLKTIYISEDFYLNWTDSPLEIKKHLLSVFNTSQWNAQMHQGLKELNSFRQRQGLGHIRLNSFNLSNVVFTNTTSQIDEEIAFIHHSSPLWMHLKQVNMYSNNFYTDKIFEFLGGSIEFSDYLYKKIGANKDEIYFYTGSGLGKNYTTCRVTLQMLSALLEVIEEEQLQVQDIIAVPSSDKGTLAGRFSEPQYKNKLVAKTGTLKDTSTLAGYLVGEEMTNFGIFNSTNAQSSARQIQDVVTKRLIDVINIQEAFTYQSPDYNSTLDTLIISQ
jgi:D-alanyl-D-alanine carboxypeptidase